MIHDDEHLHAIDKELRMENISTIGSHVLFGNYEQDRNTQNGKEDIEWIVLDVRKGNALLISVYGLDDKNYNDKNQKTTWEKSTLRKWLNSSFIESAFNETEQACILTTNVDNSAKQSKDKINSGNNTKDKVFLLSESEVETYFSTKESRKCKWTDYGSRNRRMTVNTASWWLRTIGKNARASASSVGIDGDICFTVINSGRAVRPVIWVSIEQIAELDTDN